VQFHDLGVFFLPSRPALVRAVGDRSKCRTPATRSRDRARQVLCASSTTTLPPTRHLAAEPVTIRPAKRPAAGSAARPSMSSQSPGQQCRRLRIRSANDPARAGRFGTGSSTITMANRTQFSPSIMPFRSRDCAPIGYDAVYVGVDSIAVIHGARSLSSSTNRSDCDGAQLVARNGALHADAFGRTVASRGGALSSGNGRTQSAVRGRAPRGAPAAHRPRLRGFRATSTAAQALPASRAHRRAAFESALLERDLSARPDLALFVLWRSGKPTL